MTDQPPSPQNEPAAPVAPPADQVSIGLGPDLGIYPEELRPAEPAQPETPAPEAEPPAAPPLDLVDAGPATPDVSPLDKTQGETAAPQGSRQQRGQEAYERGLAEGRAAAERERVLAEAARTATETQRAATQRVELLFSALESPDPNIQTQAQREILQLYRGNQQASALQTSTRQVILGQLAADFLKLKGAEGISDEDYQQLHTAADPAELARRAISIGKTRRDDEVAKLQAELMQLRGRLIGRTASPQPANGVAGGSAGVSWDAYISMSPAEARKLTPRQIDAIVAEHARELEASTNGSV